MIAELKSQFLSCYGQRGWFRRGVDAVVILALLVLIAIAHSLLSLSALRELSDMLNVIKAVS